MNYVKKGLSILLLGVFSYTSMGLAYAGAELTSYDENGMYNEAYQAATAVVHSRNYLKSIKSGSKYISSIDKVIKKIEKDEDKLIKLQSKLAIIEQKLAGKTDKKSNDILAIISYINTNIVLSLVNISSDNSILNQLENSKLTHEDKQKVNEEIIKLQLLLVDSAQNYTNKFIKEFDRLTKYQESGDLNLGLILDIEDQAKADIHLNLNDYTTTNNNFDSRFQTDFELGMDVSVKNTQNVSLQIQGMLDLIQKDGGIYALLEEYKVISQENIDDLESMLKTLEDIAIEKKYISYSDKNSQEALALLRSLSPEKLFGDARSALTKPMFEAYKKDGDKYYIVPTKYACDTMKSLLNKFDPFNGKTCTQSQYERYLKNDFQDTKLYLEINSDSTKIGMEEIDDDMQESQAYIIYNDDMIKEIKVTLIPGAKMPNEQFIVDYKSHDHLNIDVMIDDLMIDFASTLNRDNKMVEINALGSAKGYRSNTTWDLTLKNKVLTGGFVFDEGEISSYDYETQTTTIHQGYTFNANLNGRTNSLHHLGDLSIVYKGSYNDELNPDSLDGKFNLRGRKVTFENNYNSIGQQSNVNMGFEIAPDYSYLISANIDAVVRAKDGEFDNQTWEYKHIGDFVEVLNMDIELKNSIINGNLEVNSFEGTPEMTAKFSGKHFQDYFKLDSAIDFKENDINPLNMYKRLYGVQEEETNNYTGNFNLEIDLRNTNNNALILINYLENAKKIFEFQLENKATRVSKEVEINKPTNTIDFKEVINKSMNY